MANSVILFTVPGDPVAQGRPRFVRMKYTNGVRAYDPEKSVTQKEAVALIAKAHGMMAEGPLRIEMTFYRKIPQSWSKKKKQQAESGEILPVTRPDVDNYIKLVLDALNGVSFKDDSAIVQIVATKQYSIKPRTVVLIRRWK